MLRKLAEEFLLDHKLCHLDKTRITAEDWTLIGTVARYNRKVKKALAALDVQLPTFAVVEKGRKEEEQLYMLIERGIFWGMGSVPAGKKISSLSKLKEQIIPYADNDFIRNSLYAYVESFPEKKLLLKLK